MELRQIEYFLAVAENSGIGGAAAALDPQLYRLLKDLRKSMAKELGIPPYVIFQDTSLEAMASTYPQTIEELQNIPGVGSGKAGVIEHDPSVDDARDEADVLAEDRTLGPAAVGV